MASCGRLWPAVASCACELVSDGVGFGKVLGFPRIGTSLATRQRNELHHLGSGFPKKRLHKLKKQVTHVEQTVASSVDMLNASSGALWKYVEMLAELAYNIFKEHRFGLCITCHSVAEVVSNQAWIRSSTFAWLVGQDEKILWHRSEPGDT